MISTGCGEVTNRSSRSCSDAKKVGSEVEREQEGRREVASSTRHRSVKQRALSSFPQPPAYPNDVEIPECSWRSYSKP